MTSALVSESTAEASNTSFPPQGGEREASALSGKEKRKRIHDLFTAWAAEQQYNVVGSYTDENGETRESGPSFNAAVQRTELALPQGVDWEREPSDEGIIVAGQLLSSAIRQMRQDAYGRGTFNESGGVGLGMRCRSNELHYTASITFVPLPENQTRIRNGAQIEFSSEDWATFGNIADELSKKAGKNLCITTWIHCHPGTAFVSPDDARVHSTATGWHGIVIGNNLLNSGIQYGQENGATIAHWRGQREIATISERSSAVPPPIGIVERDRSLQYFFQKRPEESALIPPILSSNPFDEEIRILSEDSRQTPDFVSISAGELGLNELDKPDFLDQISISLVFQDTDEDDDLGIVIYPSLEIRTSGSEEPFIVITNVSEDRILDILRSIKQLLGLV